MDSLWIGPVTTPWISFAWAIWMPRSMYSTDALPHMALTLPYWSWVMSTLPRSRTSTAPGVKRASDTLLMGAMVSGRFVIRRASVMEFRSPMTKGRVLAYTDGSARALAAISGPMLAGSPMVMPRMGRSMMACLLLVLLSRFRVRGETLYLER